MTQISNNVDVEVRNMSEQSVEIIGGRLKQFACLSVAMHNLRSFHT